MGDVAVKICGLQSVEVLKSMINLPIDYIGFVFAKSKRQVTAVQAAELIQVLQQWESNQVPNGVGVFVNPSHEELSAVLKVASLDIVQLHGQESPDFCREVKERYGVKVYKVISVQHEEGSESTSKVMDGMDTYRGAIDGLLLDTYDANYGGGSGITFAWDQVIPYQAWTRSAGIPLIVAGGLRPDNVGQLIDMYAPDGVDVSSGVETDGVKDLVKMTAFVERVKV